MINSEKRRSESRCCLIVLFVLGLATLFFAVKASDAAAKKPAQWLKTVSAQQHGDYASVIFEFDRRFSFEQPVITEREVRIVFRNAGTAMPKFRRYEDMDSWLRLEKKGRHLRASIGIPKDFPTVTHLAMKEPERLVIRFGREDNAPGAPAAMSPDMQKSGLAVAALMQPAGGRAEGRTTAPSPPGPLAALSARSGDMAKTAPSPDAGPRRSYNYLDIDIRHALSALAQDQEVNVIMAPEVVGKISVHLNQVLLEEAIRSIALAGGFTYRKEGESFFVYKPKQIADPQAERLQIRVFKLKFAAIDKVQEILSAIPGMRTIRLHEPSKTIIVEDTPENIAKIEQLLRSWDMVPQQVLIEARIMQVNLTDDMSMGVDWQKIFGDLAIGTTGFVGTGIGFTGNLLTAAGTRDQFAAAVKALQTKTRVNTLSTPKILALHGKPSRVQVGSRQGYKTSTSTLGVVTETVNFLDTGTILDITPYIDDGGNVLLDVKPQINSVTFDATGTPNQKTTTVSTSMLAKNGQTMFIGGLMEDTRTGVQNAIPCFGSIPGLGLLFGQLQQGTGKSELIVLITPQIIDPEKPNTEGQEKTRQMQEKLEKEPRSLPGRLLRNLP